jgi:hypothetical protein
MVAYFLLFCSNAVGPILIVRFHQSGCSLQLQCLISLQTSGLDVRAFQDTRGARYRYRSSRHVRLSHVGVDVK